MARQRIRTVTFTLRKIGKFVIRVNLPLPNLEINRPKLVAYYAAAARQMVRYKQGCLAAFVHSIDRRKFLQHFQDADKATLINVIFNAGAEEAFFKEYRFDFPGKSTGVSYTPSKSWLEITHGSMDGNLELRR